MKISKKGGIGVIEDSEDKEAIRYCPRCKNFGFDVPLGDRIYQEGEPYSESDAEKFKQCHSCGKIVPIYKTKVESELSNTIEPTDNPFNEGKTVTGLGNKKPKSKYEKERQRLIKRANKETDSDIRREILKGNIVEIIDDY